VLDSQRRLLQAESDLLRTEQAWRSARVNLIQALGGSWDEPTDDDQPADTTVSAMR
jgi:outer membrane protein TolC